MANGNGTVALAPPRADLKLDLACGQTPLAGFHGVDLHAAGAQKVDLTQFPWPWASGSVAEIHCSHFVEHLPMVEVDHGGRRKDLFFAFFDEVYRILAPGATARVVVPALQSVRAFQDPTHRRFLPAEAFLYLAADWRKANKLDHYPVDCDFLVSVAPSVQVEENARHPEVAGKRLRELWNVAVDLHATLVRRP